MQSSSKDSADSSSTNENSIRRLRDRDKIKQTEFYGYPVTDIAESVPSNHNEAKGICDGEGLHLAQFDIKTAFLYGTLQETIYMEQPDGFNDGTSRVCKLLKSLYGLKQASRCWSKRFTSFVENFGFLRSTADPCLYILIKGDKRMFLAIYVDDWLLATTDAYVLD